MLLIVPISPYELVEFIRPFKALVGKKRWMKHLDQLATDKDDAREFV